MSVKLEHRIQKETEKRKQELLERIYDLSARYADEDMIPAEDGELAELLVELEQLEVQNHE